MQKKKLFAASLDKKKSPTKKWISKSFIISNVPLIAEKSEIEKKRVCYTKQASDCLLSACEEKLEIHYDLWKMRTN